MDMGAWIMQWLTHTLLISVFLGLIPNGSRWEVSGHSFRVSGFQWVLWFPHLLGPQNTNIHPFMSISIVVVLLYVHGKYLWLCLDGQLT